MSLTLRFLQVSFLIFFVLPLNLDYNPSSNIFVIWNVGYGGWSTWIKKNLCQHYDIGGQSFKFNLALIQNCLNIKNNIYLTKTDRYHLSFNYQFKNLFTQDCPRLSSSQFKEIHTPISTLDPCKVELKPIWCIKQFGVTLVGHIKNNFYQSSCNILLVLPGHGSKKYIQEKNILQFLKYKMLATSIKSRGHTQDLKTEALFKKHGRKLIYLNAWGHLVLQKHGKQKRP